MLTCSTIRTKDSCLITRFQTLWPSRVTMLWYLCQSTISKPHQIQWVWVHFCCSSNSLLLGTDVLKYELCVYPPVLFEAAGTMLQSDKPSQANALQVFKSPSMSVTSMLEVLWSKKNPWKTGQTCESLCGNYIEYVKEIGPTKVLSAWWLFGWSFYKRQFSSEMEEIIRQ